MSMAVSFALTGVSAFAQTPAAGTLPGSAEQEAPRPSRVHLALSTGIDFYRRGDYEKAATYFKQAQAGQEVLAPEERQTLTNWSRQNSTALQARQAGAMQLQQAEDAMRRGRSQEALFYLKAVTSNQQFLTATDKQRLQQLTERLQPGKSTSTQSAGPAGQARTMLRQARFLLKQGNFDAAQSLATEAARLGAT